MTDRNIWIVSDTHFGHENIIKYCNRPFRSIWDMNQCMVDNWNSVVKPQDIIYHLGDVYMPTRLFSGEDCWSLMKKLQGHKRLVLGNHDNGEDRILLHFFEKIRAWRHFKEYGLLLTHVPVHPDTLNEKIPINVHGHIHNNEKKDNRYKNVSVEVINYTPVNIDELRVK